MELGLSVFDYLNRLKIEVSEEIRAKIDAFRIEQASGFIVALLDNRNLDTALDAALTVAGPCVTKLDRIFWMACDVRVAASEEDSSIDHHGP